MTTELYPPQEPYSEKNGHNPDGYSAGRAPTQEELEVWLTVIQSVDEGKIKLPEIPYVTKK